MCFIQKTEKKKNKLKNLKDLKKNFDYLYQFYFLYKSIKKHFKTIDYNIYVLNTVPFPENINNALKKMGVIVLTRTSDHLSFNRKIFFYINYSESYIENIRCDYKMILDADTLFVSDITIDIIEYIKTKDALGMYGSRNFNKSYYTTICNKLGLKIPDEINQRQGGRSDGRWTTESTYLYNKSDYNINNRLFPYFNNGAIIIKNSLSKSLGILWKNKRSKLTKMGYNNLGQNGELTIGLCINHITNNWGPLPKGFNLVCSVVTADMFTNLKVENKHGVKPILIHWQLLNINSNLYKKYVSDIINNKNINEFHSLLNNI